jgi:SAM-dependent methyltransferase
MKVCLSCGHRFEAIDWRCPKCRHAPPKVQGFPIFASSTQGNAEGFKVEYFQGLAELEAGHFWFRNRNRLLTWALSSFFPSAKYLLEIGCGTGFVLSGIRETFPALELAGSELFIEGLIYARSRLPDVSLYQMDAVRIPFEAEFDVIGAFDVLEHIQDDRAVFQQLYQALKPGGGLMITVPQHPRLWSAADERACHKRRYTRRELIDKVHAAGFSVRRLTSFVTLLLPLMWISRKRQKSIDKSDPYAEYRMSSSLNRFLFGLLSIERDLIGLGYSFPLGGSLLLVAQRV